MLNLPLGCRVEFDDRVIDIFAKQVLDPRQATRHNIARILVYLYLRLTKSLGRRPNARDVDRNQMLDSSFYANVFGSWKKFEGLMAADE